MNVAVTDKVQNSWFCFFVILVTQITVGILVGYNLSALNSSEPAIKVFINDSYTERYGESPADDLVKIILTLAQSMLVWGSLIGALMVKPVLQTFSRKGAVMVSHGLNILSVVLMGPAAKFGKSYESLIIGRTIAGISRGVGFSTIMVIIAETSCRRRLGFNQSPFSTLTFVGSAIGAALGHDKVLGTPELWVSITCIPAVMSLIYSVCWPWLPETPVWLLRQGKREEAVLLLKKLRVDSNVEQEIEIMQNEINEQANTKPMPLITMLRAPPLRLQFFTSLIVMNTPQLAGIQAILLYSNSILIQAGVDNAYVTFATVGLFMEGVIALLIYAPLQRRIGTKKVFVVGLCIIGISYLLFTVANGLHTTIPSMSYVSLAAMCTLLFGIQLGPHLTMFSLSAELTTASSRPTLAFYSGCMFWALGGTIALVFPYSIAAWKAYAYIPFVIITCALIPFGIFVVPETHGRSAMQIHRSFRKKSMQSVTEIFTLSGNANDSKYDTHADANNYTTAEDNENSER